MVLKRGVLTRREALKDKLNQRFIMLSESCAPLYPPAVVYQQLMYERKSRINACDSDPDFYRDNYRQAPYFAAGLLASTTQTIATLAA